ncbi:unnamed protein product, partial [Ectocarpus sp. 12 AP-2014]
GVLSTLPWGHTLGASGSFQVSCGDAVSIDGGLAATQQSTTSEGCCASGVVPGTFPDRQDAKGPRDVSEGTSPNHRSSLARDRTGGGEGERERKPATAEDG